MKRLSVLSLLCFLAVCCLGMAPGVLMMQPSTVVAPSATAVDDFNRSNEDPLTSTNWYGNPWASYPSYTMKVVSNAARGTAGGYSGAVWKNVTATDMEVIVPVTTLPSSGGQIVLLVRHNWAAHTGYECEFDMKSASTLAVLFFRWDNNSTGITSLGLPFNAGLTSITAGDLLSCQIVGDQLSAWIYHDSAWHMMYSKREGTYSSSGLAGFGVYESSTTATFTDFRALSLD